MTMQAPAAPAKAAQATASVAPVAAVGACVAAFGALAMVAHRRKRTRQFQAETTWETVGTVAFRDLARMICCVVHSLTRICCAGRTRRPSARLRNLRGAGARCKTLDVLWDWAPAVSFGLPCGLPFICPIFIKT
jgi:hypothetical protein